jgi:hypothetical protein
VRKHDEEAPPLFCPTQSMLVRLRNKEDGSRESMKKRCTDPKMEFSLVKEISLANAQGRALNLSGELERHLEECDSCRNSFPEWLKKMKDWNKRARQIESSAEQ